MRIVADIIEYTAQHMPKFNSISISGYHMEEAGATSVQELAFTLADGLEYVRAALSRGLEIDEFAPRLSFFFGIGMNFFMEIAKLRAARVLWARLMRHFAPKNHAAGPAHALSDLGRQPLRQDPRTTSFADDRGAGRGARRHPVVLPTRSTRRWPCHPGLDAHCPQSQLILAEETGIPHVVDPLGGSYYVESLTHSIAAAATAAIDEVEAIGGMTKAVEPACRNLRIEEPPRAVRPGSIAARRRLSGSTIPIRGEPTSVELLDVDNGAERQSQIERLERIAATRDAGRGHAALAALTNAATTGEGDLLAWR